MGRNSTLNNGIRWSLGAHGFCFRPRSDSAPYGWRVSNTHPTLWIPNPLPVYYSTRTAFYYYYDADQNQLAIANHSQIRQRPMAELRKTLVAEKSLHWPMNQHAFIWKQSGETWTPKKTVFSWAHSSSGDGPCDIYRSETTFSVIDSVGLSQPTRDFGTARPMQQMTPSLPISAFTAPPLNSYYRVLQSPLTAHPFEPWVIAPDVIRPEILRDGKSWFYETGGYWYGQSGSSTMYSAMYPFPVQSILGEDGVFRPNLEAQRIEQSWLLGVGPLGKKRVLAVVGHVFNGATEWGVVPDSSTWSYQLRLYDIEEVHGYWNFRVDEIKLGNAALIELPFTLTNSENEVIVKSMPFMWGWRFNQSMTEVSGLYLDHDAAKPVHNYAIMNNESFSVVRATFAITYDAESDRYSVTHVSSEHYTPRLRSDWNQVSEAPVPYPDGEGGTYVPSTTSNANRVIDIDQGKWPFALDYVDNLLKLVWFVPRFETETISVTASESHSTTAPRVGYGLSRSSTGYCHFPGRGVRGTLHFDSGPVVDLNPWTTAGAEQDVMNTMRRVFGGIESPPEATSGTASRTMYAQTVPLYVSVRGEIVVTGARCQSLKMERTVGSYTVVASAIPNEWDRQTAVTRKDTGGALLWLHRNGIKTVLFDDRNSLDNSFNIISGLGGYGIRWVVTPDAICSPTMPTNNQFTPGYGSGSEDNPQYYLYHPLEGLCPSAFSLGLCEEVSDGEGGQAYLNFCHFEHPGTGFAFDPRTGDFMLSVEYSALDDQWISDNIYAAQNTYPHQHGDAKVCYASFPSVAAGRFINRVFCSSPEREAAFAEYLLTLPGTNPVLYPIGLF